MGKFSGFGLQKFTSRRGIEVEVMHFHRGAGDKCCGFRLRQMSTFGLYPPGMFFARSAACQRKTRNRRNACQRLATKTQACYVLQVFERLDLAGGVAGKRKGQIIPSKSRFHYQLHGSAWFRLERVVPLFRWLCIDAVLQHFLECRGGTLHDLSGGNLADKQVRKKLDRIHGQGGNKNLCHYTA